MGWIDKNIDNYENTGWGARNNMNQQLFETMDKWKWAELKQLLEWYFSMINHLGEFDYLVDNVDYYDEALSKLVDFSKTPFMEKTIWRVSDNWKFKEYCWAHLRNLLSPFKNMIGLINGFSEGKVNTELLRSFKDKLNLDNNEKEFLEFCVFLEEK